MRVYHDLKTVSERETAVALGCFDGLHIGHQKVIAGVTSERGKGLVPAVFTFDASPLEQLRGRGAPLLATNRRKAELLEELGVECVYMPRFEEVWHMSAREFVEKVLCGVFRARIVSCGFNFRFGEGGRADSAELTRLCAGPGIEVRVAPAVLAGGEPVSSTRIRRLIAEGNAEKAAVLLGRPFGFDFEVAHGRRLGRRLGTPTVNQRLPENFVRPRFGVYASAVTLPGGARRIGVTNVGIRPTVKYDGVLAETMILDWSGDLYGKRVLVDLLRFLRPERKFGGLDEMKAAILCDAETARTAAEPYLQNQDAMI
mgnify:FL=1